MTYTENPDHTGKAPNHKAAAIASSLKDTERVLMQNKMFKQFKTEKKEFSIEEFATSANNCLERTVTFKLKVTRPFSAEAVFSARDIGQRQKVDGIVFNNYSNIAKALNTKQECLFSLPAEAITFIQETNKTTIDRLKAEALTKTVSKWFWAIGGDSYNLYVSPDIDTEFRSDLKAIEGVFEETKGNGNITELLREKSKPCDRKTGLYTDQWYEITVVDFMKIYEIILNREDHIGKEKKAKQEAREKARQEIFTTAKATGIRQILSRWSEECNDRNEECDLDNVVEYAMPDGTTKTERNHTW